MNGPRCRRFNIGDGMISIVLFAVSFAVLPIDSIAQFFLVGSQTPETVMNKIAWGVHYLIPPWFVWTVGYFGFRLRRPRPPFPELRVQPGMVACVAASGMFLPTILSVVPRLRGSGLYLGDILSLILGTVPPAVIGGWLTLRFVGQWNPEMGWIDRLGRILGWGWVSFYLIRLINNT